MKIILICLFLLIFINEINSQGLNSITSPNGINIIAVGDSGKVMQSTNSGNSWNLQTITSFKLNSVYSLNQHIWIAGDNGNIFKLDISDTAMFSYNLGTEINLYSIFFLNDNTGYVCGENGKIFISTNGGINWSLRNNGIQNVKLNSITFKDGNKGYVAGNNGIIYKTLNSGVNWSLENSNTSTNLLSIKYFGDSVLCCGEYGTLLIKKQNVWTTIYTRIKNDIRGISVDNLGNIHLCGGGGFIRNNKKASSEFLNFESNPMLANLVDIFYYDSNLGFAVSSLNNAVIKTSNGGANWNFPKNVTIRYVWENKLSGLQNGYGNTLAMNPIHRNTFFVAYTNKVFVSRDKGETWNIVSTIPYTINRTHSFFVSSIDTNIWLASVAFSSGDCPVIRTTDYGVSWHIVLDSVVVGSYTKPLVMDQNNPALFYYATVDRGFFRSTNSGSTFTQISNFKFNNPCDLTVQYNNSNNILIADASYPGVDSSKIYKSTNGGINWSINFKVGQNEIPTITNTIFNENESFAAAEKFYRSSNFGETWNGITNSFETLWALDICREDPSCIFPARFDMRGFLSTDGGANFSIINHPSSSVFLSAILFPERDYAIGMFHNSLFKLKFSYDVNVGVIKTSDVIAENFNLYQNYPNPFNPKTVINYNIPVPCYVSLKVFDILGQEVCTLVNQKQYSGNYNVEFDGNNLSSDIYFYKIVANSFTETKKMILIR